MTFAAAGAAALILFSSGCGTGLRLGDTGAVREANRLAIECRTDEALAAVDRAVSAGGFGGSIGDLQRVVFLRDAGRYSEASAALAERNRKWNVTPQQAADAERAIEKSIGELRDEREKATGRRTCP